MRIVYKSGMPSSSCHYFDLTCCILSVSTIRSLPLLPVMVIDFADRPSAELEPTLYLMMFEKMHIQSHSHIYIFMHVFVENLSFVGWFLRETHGFP
jgi:hypothetical protein